MTTDTTVTRRGVLATLAAGALAGCLGTGDGASSGDPTGTRDTDDSPTPGTTTGLPTESDGPGGDTSLAGSCAAAFGDTDRRYEPDDRDLSHTFAYPLAGEVVVTEDEATGGHLTRFGYAASGDGRYEQYLSVRERVVDDGRDSGAVYAGTDAWSATTVSYQGRERTVAVNSIVDDQRIWIFSATDAGTTYEFEVLAERGTGDACPDAYHAVCRRVAASFEPR